MKGPLDSILNMPPQVSETIRETLSLDFIDMVVNTALKQIHPNKAPNPAGMPHLFFQYHWHIVGPSITKALLFALNTKKIPQDLNHPPLWLITAQLTSAMSS